jgi:hypothetical protein
MHDGQLLEVRFTELSPRKREALSQAILELIEQSKSAATPA